MFEKSLYDLIKGIRSHKGNEKQYIQKVLKECRAEVRSQDMDVKATALLKLVYLEMVGHDMSWASFHVLEVMSSPKYHQKRVGYLGAVQSFRSDTEVLMLATNLLKKDLSATPPIVMSLPIAALPHVITPSLALSTLADLLPRLGHSHANIRKKSLVTLYRLALVYPETLRAAWPKIKERLMDPDEDSSVTAAIVNVICELGWRRPHDFLPLAPRLFELLVDGNNNWMAIKLIKLFAILTPLEPRLTRKLLPPLTNIIRTTPAMSLLYECINGIIQGGILSDESSDTDEIATLCVSKLRGMITINGDPNLKYVALLAFNKIVLTHPHLVSEQEDVILDCIDNPDITIRIQALDLFQGMVSADNLSPIVSRLMKQLKLAAVYDEQDDSTAISIDSSYDSEGEPKASPQTSQPQGRSPPLPEDYRLDVVTRILQMSSKDNYANILDFDWYIDILTQLVRIMPVTKPSSDNDGLLERGLTIVSTSRRIGNELRNVAVKVRAMRSTAVRAADEIIYQLLKITPVGHSVTSETLQAVVWILGEYCQLLQNADDTLNNLLQLIPRVGSIDVVIVMIQAIAKIFAAVAGDGTEPWTAERKSRIALLMARILHVTEPFALHPNLEVQERASEFIELMKLTAEAAAGQPASTNELSQDAPLLLTQAIPSLFNGWELNSVAPGAQYHVRLLENLDLEAPIHRDLPSLLARASLARLDEGETDAFEAYYNERPAPTSISSTTPALNRLADPEESQSGGYQQQPDEDAYLDPDIVARRKAKRLELNRDDPFYISNDAGAVETTSIHNIIQSSNGDDVDIDSIPIMKLDLDKISVPKHTPQRQAPRPRQQITVETDEMLQSSGAGTPRYDSETNAGPFSRGQSRKIKQGLLQVDSSTIGSFTLEGEPTHALGLQQQQEEDAEMQKAMHEVEKLRLEMQRANERIQVAQGVDTAGIMVKKKKKKVVKDDQPDQGVGVKVKKKKPKVGEDGEVVIPKKKKKRAPVTFSDEPGQLDN